MPRICLLLLFCFLSANTLLAQQDTTALQYNKERLEIQEITKEELQAYKEDPDFNYEIVKEETWWDNFTNWLGNLILRFFEWLFGVEKASGILALFIRLIPYILLGILIFLLVKFFLKVNANAPLNTRTNTAFVSLSEEENIIKNEDIDELIQKALKTKNYRLAIRYYYLLVLQLLSEKELITWELQKTNYDYLREMQKKEFKASFKNITRLYDHIWYGNFEIDESKYLSAAAYFSSLREMLNKNV